MVLIFISLSLHSFQTLWWQSLKTNILAASWKKKCPRIRDEGNASIAHCGAEDLQVWWKSVVHVHVDGPDCIMAIN